jgi:DNA-binding NarL/FixJ family response regulator
VASLTKGERTEPIRVLVVDDHDLYRTALRDLLSARGLVVVGDAATGEEAVRLARDRAPDVVLMDIDMPGFGGVEATMRIGRDVPGAAVVILTVSAEEKDVLAAVVAGARGYLLKTAPLEEIVAGVRAAACGDAVVSPSVAVQVVKRLRATPGPVCGERLLSERDRQILVLLARGKDNAEIARELFMSPHTVKNAVTELLRKLGVRNRIEAAVYAARTGLS